MPRSTNHVPFIIVIAGIPTDSHFSVRFRLHAHVVLTYQQFNVQILAPHSHVSTPRETKPAQDSDILPQDEKI